LRLSKIGSVVKLPMMHKRTKMKVQRAIEIPEFIYLLCGTLSLNDVKELSRVSKHFSAECEYYLSQNLLFDDEKYKSFKRVYPNAVPTKWYLKCNVYYTSFLNRYSSDNWDSNTVPSTVKHLIINLPLTIDKIFHLDDVIPTGLETLTVTGPCVLSFKNPEDYKHLHHINMRTVRPGNIYPPQVKTVKYSLSRKEIHHPTINFIKTRTYHCRACGRVKS